MLRLLGHHLAPRFLRREGSPHQSQSGRETYHPAHLLNIATANLAVRPEVLGSTRIVSHLVYHLCSGVECKNHHRTTGRGAPAVGRKPKILTNRAAPQTS